MSELLKESQPNTSEENSKEYWDKWSDYFDSMDFDTLMDELRGPDSAASEQELLDPKIYNPDQNEINSFSKEITERVSTRDMLDFVKMTYETDMDSAEEFLVSKLAEAYELKNIPDIVHLDAGDDSSGDSERGGGFDRYNNTIVLYFGKNKIDSNYSHIEMLSHELWHAKQYETAQDDSGRGGLYKKNFNHYIKYGMDAEGYGKQLLEAEAYNIGTRIASAYMAAQYFSLDSEDRAELRALKDKCNIRNESDLAKAVSDKKINRDEYWLLYNDFQFAEVADSL